MKAFTVAPAEHGGFVVYAREGTINYIFADGGNVSAVDFAGTLAECLSYVERQLALPPKPASREEFEANAHALATCHLNQVQVDNGSHAPWDRCPIEPGSITFVENDKL